MEKKADLLETAGRSLDAVKKKLKGCGAELYLMSSVERAVELRDGEISGISQSENSGLGLRLFKDGKMSFACASRFDEEDVDKALGKALAQLPEAERDRFKNIPIPPAPAGPDAPLQESLWDASLFSESWDKVVPKLRDMEKRSLARDKRLRSVLRSGYGECRSEVAVVSTAGTAVCERQSSASVGLALLGEDAGEHQVGSAAQYACAAAELDFKKTAEDAAFRTAALLGGEKLPTGRRPVVLDPSVAGEFLELIAELLRADAVQRGRSLLAGKQGQKVGSSLATFVDDPRRLGGLASSLFDDEGYPTFPKTMISGGVLREYFYDSYTAAKEGIPSNASAGRDSYRNLPGPGCSNFYLTRGSMSKDKLLADTQGGIYVLDVMGIHTVDPISGEMSIGVSGLALDKGAFLHPVKQAMVSANLLEFLDRIDAVADDLTFYGDTGAPTFRVSDLAVA